MGRKNLVILFVAISLGFAISASAADTEPKFTSLQCDMITETAAKNLPVTKIEGKYFIKGKKIRMESNSPAGALIFLFDGQKGFQYFPAQNKAIRVSQLEVMKQQISERYKNDLSKTIVGQEDIDGRLCDIYRINDPNMGTINSWVARDINFPVKQETGMFKSYFKNIKTDLPLDDSLFELPAGVEIEEKDNDAAMNNELGSGDLAAKLKELQQKMSDLK